MRIIIGVALAIVFIVSPVFAKEITISVMQTTHERTAYHRLFEAFTQETGIKVNTIALVDIKYKKQLPKWLLDGEDTPDVIYWNASQRLFFYTKKNLIHPITQLWKEEKLDQYFSHVKNGVSYKGDVYAIPYSHAYWGIFYKKSLIEKYGGIPKTWEEFIVLCEKMKKNGITPIGIGTKSLWPSAAWFDYLNLRINGLEFHQLLLDGKISFYDKRVSSVFVEWKRLIDKGFFNEDNKELLWDQVLGSFYRDKIGFMLVGNFITKKFPQSIKQDIGFMPFPKIKEIPLYEEAPTNVFMIPKNSKNIKEAEAFIKFIARVDNQSSLNKDLGSIPPHREGTVSLDPLVQAGATLLKKAKEVSQYFDRDTLPAFEKKAVIIFTEFTNTGDIKKATNLLEMARQDVFIKQ